jgi:hypothetical protein
MSDISELERLYRLIWREAPSPETVLMLEAIENAFGMAKNDPLSQMLVLLLRVADQMRDILDERTEAEQTVLKDLRNAADELKRAARVLEAVQVPRQPVSRLLPSIGALSRVNTYNRHSPLFSYLSEAFLTSLTSDDQERSIAARWDLGFVAGALSLVIMFAMWVGKTFMR